MKKTFLFFVVALMSVNLYAQSSAKSVYAEIGGPELASINYNMRFAKKEGGFGFRAGLGGLSLDGTRILLVPLGLNYITSKDGKNYFELGAGATLVNAFDDNYNDMYLHQLLAT